MTYELDCRASNGSTFAIQSNSEAYLADGGTQALTDLYVSTQAALVALQAQSARDAAAHDAEREQLQRELDTVRAENAALKAENAVLFEKGQRRIKHIERNDDGQIVRCIEEPYTGESPKT